MDARQIPPYPDKLRTEVQGTIEAPDGIMKITKIHCHYHIQVPEGKKTQAERVLPVFEKKCPVAQTLKGCVELIHDWTIEEYKE
ncbi:OsmC family protein [Alkalicoccus saliphilus]|uniref:OsmC family peroxiredoxin n=1 Tax=Alkalicoccus saliphilus TaxID=200989 RepID=A0A2T4U8Q9_9BACI|nr:OsmC family protein [Alkalicoccus saliphilus]PTL39757.1 hypothetical protein C6Y45_03660 [Alkalicoccus saliphilus]